MFVYDIKLVFSDECDDYQYAMIDFYCSLSGNNQIIIETLNISGKHPQWTLRVTTPYIDSLDEKNNDDIVNQAIHRLKPHLAAPIEKIYVGTDGIYQEDCATGEKADSYVLWIHPHMQDFSPICCGHCSGNIPYYLLPKLSEKTMKELTAWQTVYDAYDKLFYATGIGEISAHKMMSNMSSRLNQDGLAVCRLLENELGKPVYYYLYRFYGKQTKKCPVCGGDWIQPEDSLFDYKCNHCMIVADKTVNER